MMPLPVQDNNSVNNCNLVPAKAGQGTGALPDHCMLVIAYLQMLHSWQTPRAEIDGARLHAGIITTGQQGQTSGETFLAGMSGSL